MVKNFNIMISLQKFSKTVSSKVLDKAVLYSLTRPEVDRGGMVSVMQGAVKNQRIQKPSETINSHLTKQESPNYLIDTEERLIKEMSFTNVIEENIYAACNRIINSVKFKHVFLTKAVIENSKNKKVSNLTGQVNPDGILIETYNNEEYILYGASDCKAYMNIKQLFFNQIILISKKTTNETLRNLSTKHLLDLEINLKKIQNIDSNDKTKIDDYLTEKDILITQLYNKEINQEIFLIKSLKLKHEFHEVLERNKLSEVVYLTDSVLGIDKINQELKKDLSLEEFHAMVEKDLRSYSEFDGLLKSNENFAKAYEKDEIKIPANWYEEIINELKKK